MFQIETTKDVLFLALAFGVIIISLLAAWGLYYLAMILRQVRVLATDVRQKIEAIDELIKKGAEKMAGAAIVGKILSSTVKVATEAYKAGSENKKKKK